jgi:O-antigen/teichoic acid export membrane protein
LWFLLRKSLPYALVVLLMSAYTRLDGILLERLLPDGARHADVFAGGYRLLDAANMFGYLFATLLMPMFARLLGQKAPVRPLVSLGFRLVWAGGWTLCVVVFLLKSDLAALMFGGKYELEYRAWTLGLLIGAFPAMCVIYIFSTLLTADERLMQMNRFFVVGLVLDVVLNLLLVPYFLALGAAMATVATQWFIAVSMVALCVYNYGFRPSPGGLTRVLVFTAAVPLSAWWLLHNDTFDALPWWWKPLLLLLLGGVLALLSGMLSRRDLRTV